MVTWSAHVQHTLGGSGYMLGGDQFIGTESEAIKQAVAKYMELVNKDENPYGRNRLKQGGKLAVTLIPGGLRGPDMMAYTGFCSMWGENGQDMYETESPEPVYVDIVA